MEDAAIDIARAFKIIDYMPVIDKALPFLFIPTNTPKDVKRPRKLN